MTGSAHGGHFRGLHRYNDWFVLVCARPQFPDYREGKFRQSYCIAIHYSPPPAVPDQPQPNTLRKTDAAAWDRPQEGVPPGGCPHATREAPHTRAPAKLPRTPAVRGHESTMILNRAIPAGFKKKKTRRGIGGKKKEMGGDPLGGGIAAGRRHGHIGCPGRMALYLRAAPRGQFGFIFQRSRKRPREVQKRPGEV